MPRPPSSAARPAHCADEPVQIAPQLLQGDRRSAPQPARYVKRSEAQSIGYGELFMFLFYNIGWQKKSKQNHHTKENLAKEICELVIAKGADAVGISEVYNLREIEFAEERQIIMNHVLSKLNGSAEQPVWTGKSDGHYIFLWNSEKLHLQMYEYISCQIPEAPWRMAQYFQFQHAEKQTGPPLHVCHCHSPSSDNQKETPTQEQIIRKLTDERRAKIFEVLWNQVEKNNPREHPCSVAEPTAIFGGDFNSSDLEWTQVLEKAWKTQASRRSIQRCVSSYSTPAHKLHKGDRAIVFNGNALQQDSHWGKKLVQAEVPRSRVTSQTTTTSCAFPFTGDSANSGT